LDEADANVWGALAAPKRNLLFRLSMLDLNVRITLKNWLKQGQVDCWAVGYILFAKKTWIPRFRGTSQRA
jgi:hypothetical protein